MDKDRLALNINVLLDETERDLKVLKKEVPHFIIDEESDIHLEEFMKLMEKKISTVRNAKNKSDIKKNIKRRKIYEKIW